MIDARSVISHINMFVVFWVYYLGNKLLLLIISNIVCKLVVGYMLLVFCVVVFVLVNMVGGYESRMV